MKNKHNYKSIYQEVKSTILDQTYPTNTLLPTETTLAEKYNVSRPTIAKVYSQLQKEGLVHKSKGKGTVILYKKEPKSNYTFGVLLPGAGESEIFSMINDQILKQSEAMQFTCLLDGTTASNAQIRKNLIESCCDNYIRRKVDGIFFSPLERVSDTDVINKNICHKISQAKIPLILIDRDIVPPPQKSPFDVVCLDNYGAGCVMAQHLIDAGCKKIYFLYRPSSAYSVKVRCLAVKNTVQEHGLPFDLQHEYCGNPEDMDFINRIRIERGKTGIICANDATAAVLMSSLESAGYKTRTDLLITGFDDMKYSQHLKCSLTSFVQPCKEIADISIELMMRKIKCYNRPPVSVYLRGDIIIRDSSRFLKP